MAKQQGPNPAKPEQKNLPKRPPVRAGILPQVEEITELAQQELAALPGGLRAAVGDGTLNSQANRLSDVRIPTAQRQTIARQIGALQGNEHLQRVAAKAKPTSPVVSKDGGNNGKRTIVQAAPAQHSSVGAANKSGRGNGGSSGGNGHQDDLLSVTGMEALEGMGGNGKTAAAATEPPPRGKKSLGAGFSSQLSVDPIEGAVAIQRKAVVQRGIAEDVANAILERVVGSASSEQSGIDTAESTAGSDVESEATSGQEAIETEGNSQAAQAQADEQAQESAAEAETSAGESEAQSQADTAQSEMNAEYGSFEGEANAQGSAVEAEANAEVGALQGEANAVQGQVEGYWTGQQGEANAQVSVLEGIARSLYASAQARARALLASDIQNPNFAEIEATITGGWNDLLQRVQAFQEFLGRIWDTISAFVSNLFSGIMERANQVLQSLSERAQALLSWVMQTSQTLVQGALSRIQQFTSWVGETVTAIQSRVSEFVTSVSTRITETIQNFRTTISQTLTTIQQRGNTAVENLRSRATSAISTVRSIAEPIASLFGERVQQIVNNLSNSGTEAVNRLANRASEIWNGAVTRIEAAGNSLANAGGQAVQSLQSAATRLITRLQGVVEQAVELLNRAYAFIQNAVNTLVGYLQQLGQRIIQGIQNVISFIRDQVITPIWNWLRAQWQAFQEMADNSVGKFLRGWQRLTAWAASAKQRASSDDPAVQDQVESEANEKANAPFENIFYKHQPGAANRAAGGLAGGKNGRGEYSDEISAALASDPQVIQRRLGEGRPLDGSVRSRMEGAFGQSFSNVRVHTGAQAGGLANDLGARAFTVGSQMAFGTGEYQPGTLIGDALIAHELAHVIQQQAFASSAMEGSGVDGAQRNPQPAAMQGQSENPALEMDADYSAINAVAALWAGGNARQWRGAHVPDQALPQLRSGLRLSSCTKKNTCPPGTTPATVKFSAVGSTAGPTIPDNMAHMPPGTEQDVTVTVSGYLDCMPALKIRADGEGGVVTLNGQSGRIGVDVEGDGAHPLKVKAGSEKGDFNKSGLYLAAFAEGFGKLKDESNRFIVAAVVTGVSFEAGSAAGGQNIPISSSTQAQAWGARYQANIASDSSNPAADLGDTKIAENISASGGTGIFSGMGVTQSGWLNATSTQTDTHAAIGSGANVRSQMDGSPVSDVVQNQYFRVYDRILGIGSGTFDSCPVVPNSGFNISLNATKSSVYVIRVTKAGADVSGASPGAGGGVVTDEVKP